MSTRPERRSHGRAAVALVLLVAALPGAAARAGAKTAATRPAASAARRQTEAQRYQAIVAKLASPEMEGRGPGTKGTERAREYLAGHLRGVGLKPAFGGSFTQLFPVPVGAKVEQQALSIAASPGAGVAAEELAAGADFQAMGFSGNGAFAGEAVFAGYSVVDGRRKYDSYAGAAGRGALKGKVAVVLRYEPQDANGVSLWTRRRGSWTRSAALASKVAHAAGRGAAAVLVINPPAHDRGRPDPVRRTSYGRKARVPVLHVTRAAWRRILAAGGRDAKAAAKALRRAADAGTGKPVPLGALLRGRVTLRQASATVHNVAGLLPGAGELAEQVLVVGAHYDHLGYGLFGSRSRSREPRIHPGADDNASGAAGVVTLARWFARRVGDPAEEAPANRRSILFVTFAGEELGLLGSRHLLAHVPDLGLRREQIVSMVNMDMIGRLRDGRLGVWGVDSGDRWRDIVREAAEGMDLTLQLSGSGFGASDHASFYRAKVPVLCLNTGMHADLHMPSDTADKINPAGAIRVLRLAEKVLLALWTEEQAVAYRPPRAGARGAFLGISFDGNWRGEGCRIGSIVDGGPAAKAGLRDGDVILKWDGKDVADASALMVLVRHSQPGAGVKLTVRRGAKMLEVKVKLGGR